MTSQQRVWDVTLEQLAEVSGEGENGWREEHKSRFAQRVTNPDSPVGLLKREAQELKQMASELVSMAPS